MPIMHTIASVLLLFSVNGGEIEVSDRIFRSMSECAMFVNTIARQPVVLEDGTFRFITPDGWTFVGKCEYGVEA